MAPNLTVDKRTKFLKIIRGLKKQFPTAFPVKIRTLRKGYFKDLYGLTELMDGKNPYFRISILQTEYSIMVDSLVHEWSHAASFSLVQKEKDVSSWHDGAFGVKYAEIYSWCMDFNGPDEIATKCKFT